MDARAVLRDAVLTTEELVSRAVQAIGVLDERPRWTGIEQLNLISVRLLGLHTSVVIEVVDCDPRTPTLPPAAVRTGRP